MPRLLALLCLAGLLSLAGAARANVTVTLKDGSVVHGLLQDVQPDTLLLGEDDGQSHSIPLDAVATVVSAQGQVVYQGPAAAAATPPPQPPQPLGAKPAAPEPASVPGGLNPAGAAPAPASLGRPAFVASPALPEGEPSFQPLAAGHRGAWTARAALGRGLQWLGGALMAGGVALTFDAVSQIGTANGDRLGTAAAAAVGLGLIHLFAGSALLPESPMPQGCAPGPAPTQLGLAGAPGARLTLVRAVF
jgi:hypothetical protein